MKSSPESNLKPSTPPGATGLFSSKVCRKCGGTEFYKSGKCKPCRNAAARKWLLEHPGKAKEASQKWNRLHGETRNANYYRDNSDKEKARSADYHAKNPEKAKARAVNWQTSNPEKNLELRRITEQNRRASKHANGGKLSPDIAAKLFTLQRGICACGCRHPLGNDYHLDHRMPLVLGGTNTDDNMQLLTSTCNLKKGRKHPVEFMQSRGFLL